MVRQPDALDYAIVEGLEHLRDVVGTLERREALRDAARKALEDAGHRDPKAHEVERVVDEFLAKRYSARFGATPADLVFTKGCKIVLRSGKVLDHDVMLAEIEAEKRTKAATPTVDEARRLEAHARHLRNLDSRVKAIERGEP